MSSHLCKKSTLIPRICVHTYKQILTSLRVEYVITNTSYDDLSYDYLKLDRISIVSSRLTDTIQCDLCYDYRTLITKSDIRTS